MFQELMVYNHIDLVTVWLNSSTPSHYHICPLSLRKKGTMDEYIKGALQQGYIVPSDFFFVEKKCVALDPAIITVELTKSLLNANTH